VNDYRVYYIYDIFYAKTQHIVELL